MNTELKILKDYILTHNSYFSEGFDDVYLDTHGFVSSDEQETPVFPADNLGDYFYLRYDGNPVLQNGPDAVMNECHTGVSMRINLVLVAVLQEGDVEQLFLNLLSTLKAYKAQGIVFRNGIYRSEDVILQELSKLPEKDREAALQRCPDGPMASIAFTLIITPESLALSCIQNPCKEC